MRFEIRVKTLLHLFLETDNFYRKTKLAAKAIIITSSPILENLKKITAKNYQRVKMCINTRHPDNSYFCPHVEMTAFLNLNFLLEKTSTSTKPLSVQNQYQFSVPKKHLLHHTKNLSIGVGVHKSFLIINS